ncbi:hypothetical protein BSKO_13688 [Bryopsis sp. KO-2023]|nr:hypothetical protein BSKO_13688 [Bryopsis sp. KO-2023]
MRSQQHIPNTSTEAAAAAAFLRGRTFSIGPSVRLRRPSLNPRRHQTPLRRVLDSRFEKPADDPDDSIDSPSPWLSGEGGNVADLIIANYRRIFNRPLVDENDSLTSRELLWNVEGIIYAHNFFAADPPVYIYGNKVGLQAFEASWDEFLGSESTATTNSSADAQQDRFALLKKAGEDGFVDIAEVTRISLKGREVYLRNGPLFTLEDKSGKKVGQAVYMKDWAFVDEESTK